MTGLEEVREHIHKIEDTARGKSSSRAERSSLKIKERIKRTKRVAVKILSSRPTRKAHSSLGSSPSSEEEAVPLTHKRKTSCPEEKSSTTFGASYEKIISTKTTSFAPENDGQSRPAPSSSTPNTATTSAPASSSAPLSSGHIPSSDIDDHLTLKKLKVLHSQESNSQIQSTVQTP